MMCPPPHILTPGCSRTWPEAVGSSLKSDLFCAFWRRLLGPWPSGVSGSWGRACADGSCSINILSPTQEKNAVLQPRLRHRALAPTLGLWPPPKLSR